MKKWEVKEILSKHLWHSNNCRGLIRMESSAGLLHSQQFCQTILGKATSGVVLHTPVHPSISLFLLSNTEADHLKSWESWLLYWQVLGTRLTGDWGCSQVKLFSRTDTSFSQTSTHSSIAVAIESPDLRTVKEDLICLFSVIYKVFQCQKFILNVTKLSNKEVCMYVKSLRAKTSGFRLYWILQNTSNSLFNLLKPTSLLVGLGLELGFRVYGLLLGLGFRV